MHFRDVCLVAAVAALSAQDASAQAAGATAAPAAPSDGGKATNTVQISTSRDSYDDRRDDTATKIVVTQDELRKYGDALLTDVLKRQPGITVSGGSAGRGGEIRMRGLGNGYTQILLNGDAAPPGFSIDSLAPEQVERIEIMRAATAEFSTQAIAGTINIILKKRVTTAKRTAKLTGEASDVFQSAQAVAEVADKKDRMSYTTVASLRYGQFGQQFDRTDEMSAPDGTQLWSQHADVENDGHFANLSITPRVNWAMDSGTLASQTFLSAMRGPFDMDTVREPNAMVPQAFTRETTHGLNRQNSARTDLIWTHKLPQGRRLEAKAGFNVSRQDSLVSEQADGTVHLDRDTDVITRQHGWTTTGKYSTPFAEGHALTAGWDLSDTRSSEAYHFANLGSPDVDDLFRTDVMRTAVYAQDDWTVTPSWLLYFGLRWESIETSSDGMGYDEVRNRSSVLSPLFQALWKLPQSKNDQLRLALTRTYKAPSRLTPRRFQTINNSPTTPDFQGNPYLKPELATGLDLAWEHYFGPGNAMVSVSAYGRRIEDLMRNDVVFVDGRWVSMPVNDGTARTRGIEVDTKFPLRQFFAGAPEVDVRANAARNWSSVSTVPGPYNRLADQVPYSANLGLDYKFSGRVSMGGTFTYKGGGPVQVSLHSGTYTTIKRELDFYALWKFKSGTQLRITGVNLLAQPFTNVSTYEDENGRRVSTTVFPFSPILRVGLEIPL